MRRLRWGLWAAWAAALMLLAAMPAQASTLELRQAVATVVVQGQTLDSSVTLPYHWDRQHKGLAGSATFQIPFELPEAPTEPFAVYIPRLGNAYEVSVNGVLLQRNGDLLQGNGADFAKGPRHIPISLSDLRKGSNVFEVRIRTDVGRRGGLAPLTLGPQDEVYRLYLSDYRGRSTGSAIVALLSALIGVIALSLWITQVDSSVPGRVQRDPVYLLACLAELTWTLSVADAIVENPPWPWPWWGIMTLGAAATWIFCVKLFSLEVAGWGGRGFAKWVRGLFVLEFAGTLVGGYFALSNGYASALTMAYAVAGISSLCFVLVFLWSAFRQGSLAHKAVAVAFLVNVLVSMRDLYVFRLSESYGGNTYMRYSSVLFGLTLGYVVVQRFRAASLQARDLTATLASRVEQKERELARSYQHLELLARDQERNAERGRILRDMHDGVGAHISTAIRQLQSGKSSDAELLHTLRDSLDQLKLSIDAMNQPAGDITALLANLRYRLEPRMKASDIDLHWAVDLLAPLPRLDDKAMRHLQFMVYEALSNVLQHAGATTVRIEAAQTPAGASIRLVDNGCGFDVLLPKRRGLLSMQDRANAVGAKLTLVSQPGHTVVEILIS